MRRLKLVASLGTLLSTSARADTCPGWNSIPWGIGHALQLPSCYTFRVMAQEGMRLSDGTHFRGKNDLNAFMPDDAHQNRVYLLVNHEETPGGASMLTMERDDQGWQLIESRSVDFNIAETGDDKQVAPADQDGRVWRLDLTRNTMTVFVQGDPSIPNAAEIDRFLSRL